MSHRHLARPRASAFRASRHLALLVLALALSAACSTSAPSGGTAGSEPAPDAGPVPEAASAAVPSLDGEYLTAELSTVGWDRLTQGPVVLLRDVATGQVVPIWIGVAEAQSIAMALHEVVVPRPMTHDLLAALLGKTGYELEELIVHDVVDGTYYGLLRLRSLADGEPLLVDTRPSDGLALAARTGASIRVARKILEETPDFEFLAPDEGSQVVRVSGLTLVAPDAALREEFGLPDRPGLLVTKALGEAEHQGLLRGDLVIEVAGEVPESPIDFLNAIKETPPGEALELRYWRDGEELETELRPALLEEPEDEPGRTV